VAESMVCRDAWHETTFSAHKKSGAGVQHRF